jgi:heme-degrading monooxygenase HmoA
MDTIITRIWHGMTADHDADAYLRYLENSGIADYKQTEGNLSVEIWRMKEGDICHFWTVTKWRSLESIQKFAGNKILEAKYYPEDANFLLEREKYVKHVETFNF